MENKKYKFIEASDVEKENFSKDLQVLLEKHGLVAESIPQIARIDKTSTFALSSVILLSKKVEIVEPEVISPIQHEDLAQN